MQHVRNCQNSAPSKSKGKIETSAELLTKHQKVKEIHKLTKSVSK